MILLFFVYISEGAETILLRKKASSFVSLYNLCVYLVYFLNIYTKLTKRVEKRSNTYYNVYQLVII